ncbi:nuclear hormone receptor HR96-like isoform X1 [Panonychus citri]|uniref:nuclear hormone receptor HR96-like isoform X1 n=1 Tax=Panonychus citri TaxID=50023 RepID=UPI002307DA8B|nr:nuclear hormone receptor HR96-like isoform X1 [Panonychus citri]
MMVPDTASLRSYVPSSRPDKPISCLVCSDKSFGNNFGAITCESCKAFFRRTANERDKLACPFNDNCEITIATRKHCRKCRLEKCFAVGMIKEWIQSEEQLKIRRAILKERKLRREMGTSGQSTKRFKTNPPIGTGGGSGATNSVGGSSISGNSNSSSNAGTNHERRSSNWPSTNVNGQSLDGSRVNRQWQSTTSTSVNINTNDKPIDNNNRQSVAQFFHKISDQNFFAHLVKANETPTRSSISRNSAQSSPLQRSSVITFTGKSSASSSPSLSITSSPERSSQDVCALDSKGANDVSMKVNSLTINSYDPDCLPVYQNLVKKQQPKPLCSHVTLSSSSSASSSTTTKPISPFSVNTPEIAPIKKSTEPPLLSSSSSSIQNQMKTPEPSLCKQMKYWVTEEIDKKIDNFVKPTTSTLPSTSTSSSLSSSQSESSKAVSLNVFHHIIDSYFTRINMRNEKHMATLALNSMEETRLIELTLAYGVFNEPLACPTTTAESLIDDCYNVSVGYLLSMTKKLTAYAELPVEDQMNLIRGTYADILAMRGIFLFDVENLLWPIKGTKMTVKFEDIERFDKSFYEDYLEFARTLSPIWRNNVIINQLIIVIMLFNCNLPNLKSPEAIRLEYCAYIYLLQRYLESSLNFSDQPKETLCHILGKINRMQSINGNLVRLSIKDQPLADIKIVGSSSLLTPD